jgi:hypothetical protein
LYPSFLPGSIREYLLFLPFTSSVFGTIGRCEPTFSKGIPHGMSFLRDFASSGVLHLPVVLGSQGGRLGLFNAACSRSMVRS